MGLAKPKTDTRRQVPPDVPDIFRVAEANDVNGLKRALQYYDVNSQDENLMTPLHYAASTLAFEAVDVLLATEGRDPTLRDRLGRTAADLAYDVWKSRGEAMSYKLLPFCHPELHGQT